MSTPIPDLPPPDELLKLEPEDLAAPLLAKIRVLASRHGRGTLHMGNECRVYSTSPNWAAHTFDKRAVEHALAAAWGVLERTGMVALDPENAQHAVYFVTKRGYAADVAEWKQAMLAAAVPAELFHPSLRTSAYGKLLRGDHDGAVFEAFRLLEIRVRIAGGFENDVLGVRLMREAFQPAARDGPGFLTDNKEVPAEQQALSDLFAGAIGRFKNPTSHRLVGGDAVSTARLLALASLLLAILDDRDIFAPDV